MSEKSRTEYSARNTSVAIFSRLFAILMGYVTRVVFTRTLSVSYVGINGLFLDIINVLSLSELGISTAVTFALFQPIADKDIQKQRALMWMYRRCYRCVAALVGGSGILLLPFLRFLIKDYQQVDHIMFIYLLYLANSVCSYLLVYKKTFLDASQLGYIGTLYQTGSWLAQDILQIIVLVTTQNFYAYLLIAICATIMGNFGLAKAADRQFPYLKDKGKELLEPEERSTIFRNIKAMMLHKFGGILINNTDNLILSAMVGLASVGCYSNYYLVIGSIKQILDEVFLGIHASVGNLGATGNSKRVKKIFEAAFFVGQWLYGLAAICLYQLLNPFIAFSFGQYYVFPKVVLLILCLNFYFNGLRKAALIFRDSLGLFWIDRYKSLAEAFLNLVFSIFLAMRFGTAGVFMGTLLSMLLTSMWIEPYILYRKYMECSSLRYFQKLFRYIIIQAVSWMLVVGLGALLEGESFMTFIGKAAIAIIVPNVIFLLSYHRTEEFHFLWNKAVQMLKVWYQRGRAK